MDDSNESGMTSKVRQVQGTARERKRGYRILFHTVLVSCVLSLFVAGGMTGGSAPRVKHNSVERSSTFLLGIFSVRDELYRRQLIRSSFLLPAAATCSLQEYLSTKTKTCRIIYTFVIGANPEGPPRYDSSSTEGITLHDVPEWASAHGENDLVYLNIKENMEEGKTSTWFQYASEISDTHGIDYVSKLDTDTYVNIDALLSLMDADLPARSLNVADHRKRYGGVLREYNTCGGNRHCLLLQSRVYMSGQFYFVSSDLATFVSSQVDEKALGVGFEDFDFGLRIFSYPGTLNLVILSTGMVTIHSSETKQDSWWENSLGIFPHHDSRSSAIIAIEECLTTHVGNWMDCVPERSNLQ